jgi:hypothetical protein
MIGWLADLAGLAGSVLQYGVAGGALALAVLCWGARFHPSVRGLSYELAVAGFGAALAAASWTASGLHHDRAAELEQAKRDLERWQQVAEEQAAQRERFAAVAFRQMQLAQERAIELYSMQEIVDDYENALASGGAGACAADEPYTRSMRKIRVVRPGTAETAGTGNGPGEPVP